MADNGIMTIEFRRARTIVTCNYGGGGEGGGGEGGGGTCKKPLNRFIQL